MKIKRKRSFLLLEVMVAILLLGLFAVPIAGTPLHFYTRELSDLYDLELQRIAESTYAEIREELFEKHSPDSFGTRVADARSFHLPDQEIIIDGITKYPSKRSYKLWVQGTKEGQDHLLYRILKCRITLSKPKTSNTYDYYLLVKWKKMTSEKNSDLAS